MYGLLAIESFTRCTLSYVFSFIKPTSTLSKPTNVVPTGIVAHEGAEPVIEPWGPQGEGAAKDPDDLEAIGDEELEGMEEVDEPEEDSKLANMKRLL